MPGIQSPDVKNLTIPKGFSIFTPEGAVNPTHLGKISKSVYTPKVTILPHFAQDVGTKVQDFSAITQLGGELAVTLEEMTAFNVALFFLGDADFTDPNAVLVTIFSQRKQIAGRWQFIATNDVGPRWYLDLHRVLISPTGAFNMIDDKYGELPLNAAHVIDDDGTWGTALLKPDVSTVAPENIFLPFIVGPLNPGMTPAFAKVGEVMTANVGAWVGQVGVAYQWKAAGVNVVGATSKTYVPQVADEGKELTVQVTMTNPVGSTVATSGPTQDVHA